jgi:hypothetical protein
MLRGLSFVISAAFANGFFLLYNSAFALEEISCFNWQMLLKWDLS